MTVSFKPAARTAIKLKLAISGPSGSGKTLGALALASGLGSKVALIDTENGSASSYAGRYAFDVLELAPPFTSKRYQEAIDAAVEAGYDVLVIDSLSHQWNGEGGILPRKEEMDKRPGSNSYTNWATFTKEHTAFLAHILHAPIHILATLRSKQDYVLVENERGKQVPKKMGMAPVQREGLEYEFFTVFDVQMDHRAVASKDRTGLFGGDDAQPVNLLDAKVATMLRTWLDAAPAALPKEPAVDASSNGHGAPTRETVIQWAKGKLASINGKTVQQVRTDALVWLQEHPDVMPFGWLAVVNDEIEARESLDGSLFPVSEGQQTPKQRDAVANGL